jgi:hypothetical protein
LALKITNGRWLYPKSLLPIKTTVLNYSKFVKNNDIKNIAHTIYNIEIPIPFNKNNTDITFVYGSKEIALKSMKIFKGINGYKLIIKENMGHCQFITNFPEEFVKLIIGTNPLFQPCRYQSLQN